MPYARLLKFGTYTFPSGFKVVAIERGRTIGHQKLARATGARQTAGTRNGIRVTVQGALYQGPLDRSVLRDRQDALRAALAQGPSRLYLYDDRYYRCMEPESEPDAYVPTGFDRLDDISISFIGPDPIMFDESGLSDTWSITASEDTRTVSVGGNAPATPVFYLTVSGAGTQSVDFTFTNMTTGETFTVSGGVDGGDVVEVDTLAKSVEIDGVSCKQLFDLLFPHLNPGANVLKAYSVAVNITQVVTDWEPRWE